MVVGYLRVSTDVQEVESQKGGIVKWLDARNMSCSNWTEDVQSGAVHWKKRNLGKLLKRCTEGDIVIVAELSRIARSVAQIFEFLGECEKKGVRIEFVKEGFSFGGGNGNAIQKRCRISF